MGEYSSLTLYELIIIILKSRLQIFIGVLVGIFFGFLIITYYMNDNAKISYKIFQSNSFRTSQGVEIFDMFNTNGFTSEYFFVNFYKNIQNDKLFTNNYSTIKKELRKKVDETELKNEKKLDYVHEIFKNYNFKFTGNSEFERSNIIVSTSVPSIDKQKAEFIIRRHIELTASNLNLMVIDYYNDKKDQFNKELSQARNNHKKTKENEVEREIYLRDTSIEMFEYEFDMKINSLKSSITLAKLMDYTEPDKDIIANYTGLSKIPQYFNGVKILEKRLENLISNKDKDLKNHISKHQVKIDNYKNTLSDAFIPNIETYLNNLKKNQDILKWVNSDEFKKTNLVDFYDKRILIESINFSRNKIYFASILIGALVGLFYSMFNLEYKKREFDEIAIK